MINKSKPTLSSRGLTNLTLCNTWEKKFKGPEIIFNFPIPVDQIDERHVLFSSREQNSARKQELCFYILKNYARGR